MEFIMFVTMGAVTATLLVIAVVFTCAVITAHNIDKERHYFK